MELPPITAQDICHILKTPKNSAAGLDHFLPGELKLLAAWSPSLMRHLASLFKVLEEASVWPTHMTKGAVVFLLKLDDGSIPGPSQYRPITILSSVYPLWSKTQHSQPIQSWYPAWKNSNTFGGKGSKPVDILAIEVAQQIANALQNGNFVGGLSYDLKKGFDSVPISLCLQIFRFRGAPNILVDAISAFYSNHLKYFSIDGCFTDSFAPSNGLVQGDPLSTLLLVSMVTAWLEKGESKHDISTGRSYADDMSIVSVAESLQTLKTNVQDAHADAATFVQKIRSGNKQR